MKAEILEGKYALYRYKCPKFKDFLNLKEADQKKA